MADAERNIDSRRFPERTFKIWVPNKDLTGQLPVLVTLQGDLDGAQSLLFSGVQHLKQLRLENVQDLPQYWRSVALDNGSVIFCRTQFGMEEIVIHVPPRLYGKPPKLIEREQEWEEVVPAFEVTDASGALVGWVLCMNGKWTNDLEQYEFIEARGSETLDPFEWGNWYAELGEPRPFSGELEDKYITKDYEGDWEKEYTEIAAHGENAVTLIQNVISTVNNEWTTSPEWGHVAQGSEAGGYTFVWDSKRYFVDEFVQTTTSYLDAGANGIVPDSLVAVISSRSTPGTYWYKTYSTWSTTYDSAVASYNEYLASHSPADAWNIEAHAPSAGPPHEYFHVFDIQQVIEGSGYSYYHEMWSTIDSKNGYGVLFGVRNISSEYHNWNELIGTIDGATWSSDDTKTFTSSTSYNEKIVVDGESYNTISGSGDYYQDNVFPGSVSVRYYRDGNERWFLFSLTRMNSNRWEYGIWRSFIDGDERFLFDVQFPFSDSGPYQSHIVPGILYENNPVYCDGKFRLISINRKTKETRWLQE